MGDDTKLQGFVVKAESAIDADIPFGFSVIKWPLFFLFFFCFPLFIVFFNIYLVYFNEEI